MNSTPTDPAAALHHPRQAQRHALGELLALARDCVSLQDEIRVGFEAAAAERAQKHQNVNWDIEDRFKAMRQQARDKHRERTEELERQHTEERRRLGEKHAQRRRDINERFESEAGEQRKALEQAIWLAESVEEAAQVAALQDLKQTVQELETARGLSTALEQRLAHRLEAYGQTHLLLEPQTAPPPTVAVDERAAEAYAEQWRLAGERMDHLDAMRGPGLLVGWRPYALSALLILLGIAGGQWAGAGAGVNWPGVGVGAGAAVAVIILGAIALRVVAARQVRAAYRPLREAIDRSRAAIDAQQQWASVVRERAIAAAKALRQQEVEAARAEFAPRQARLETTRDQGLRQADDEHAAATAQLGRRRQEADGQLREWLRKTLATLDEQEAERRRAAAEEYERFLADHQQDHARRRADLERRWNEGLKRLQQPLEGGADDACPDGWDDAAWRSWTPARSFAAAVPLGRLRVDVSEIVRRHGSVEQFTLPLPPAFDAPAMLAFPREASLLVRYDRLEERARAIDLLRLAMTRLLVRLPAGRVRFVLIDPVGLGQSFAGFMHLADHDEALVGTRIWTEEDQIEQRLADLTVHMETVIQKYLRNEFATIDEYNAQAGELAEPYRFLVIADYPTGMNSESIRRLASIASTGARCGVYTLVAQDGRVKNAEAELDELKAHGAVLRVGGGAALWDDAVYREYPLRVDEPPSDAVLTALMQKVGAAAKEAGRVEVPFETIAPSAEKFWSQSTRSELVVPIGRSGATRLQHLRLGRGVAQHALIAGKTGSGKSTLLHAIVTNAAMWFSPRELELYLVDFKKGVEFKTYSSHRLPHARVIAVESDREFGLSVLQRLDAELTRRGEQFRRAGVQDLPGWRDARPEEPMPRVLFIVDEFQEFFAEDDKLAQDAGVLLDRLVRQGRAFGVHVLLGSQTIGGAAGLSRATLGQMAVRVALQCSEADSQLILGETNSAARLLSRPGEAIYNDGGGLVENNSPFQVAWLPDPQRDGFLRQISARASSDATPDGARRPVVFEGNVPARIEENAELGEALAGRPPTLQPPRLWLGEPVAIKPPTSIALRPQAGANVIMVGQQDEAALATMGAALISVSACRAGRAARIVLLDGTPADAPGHGALGRLCDALPHDVAQPEYRAAESAIDALWQDLQRRADGAPSDPAFLFVHGLQRFRVLRRGEEAMSFSFSAEKPEKPDAARQFADLIRDGPAAGIHVVAWCDTLASLERTFDRGALREFDHRVLFQMSANDSTTLVDTPAANRLGANRALVYSEEAGTIEKFRPYAPPQPTWLEASVVRA